jgi:hypothetical protein
MAAKKGSFLGTCLTTLFTSFLAPILVHVVCGALHPADNTTSQVKPAVAQPSRLPPAADAQGGWNHPWADPAPVARGG